MKILFTLLNYGSLTGSEMYVYELAKELSKNHTVIIQSQITKGILYEKTLDLGVPMVGWWSKRTKIDVVHASQIQTTVFSLANYNVPVVQTIHSEILPQFEAPVEGCSAYISIRPEIQQAFAIDSKLIYNPFDFSRFKPSRVENVVPIVLFVGPVDYLRSQAIADLIAQVRRNEIRLIGIGRGWTKLEQDNVITREPLFEVEEWIKLCDYTAGIKLGRSTIEGWLCGKPAIIYDVDSQGKVVNKSVQNPPKDLSKFDSRVVASQIEEIYDRVIYSNAR